VFATVAEKKKSEIDLYRRLLLLARPYWPHLGGLFLLGLASTPLTLLTPVPLKLAIDSVVGNKPLPKAIAACIPEYFKQSDFLLMLFIVALMLTLSLMTSVHDFVTSLLRKFTGEKLQLRFRDKLFQHLQQLSLSYHDSRGTADAVYRVQWDAPAINYISIDGLIPFVSACLQLVAMVVVIGFIDTELAIIAIAISPFLFAVAYFYRIRLRDGYSEMKHHDSRTQEVLQETLGALRVVKAFGREGDEHNRYMHHANATISAWLQITRSEGLWGGVVGFISTAGTAAVLFIGIRHVQAGVLSLGDLLLVMAYLGYLYGPLNTLGQTIIAMQSHYVGARRALAVLDEIPEVVEQTNPTPLRRARGEIMFKDVSFSYDDATNVFKHVSLKVDSRSRIGLIGRTGAGKTTIVSLLMRLYDPTAGKIFLDGINLKNYKLADLRNQFSVVLQEPVLFSRSIAENIAYGCPDSSREEVIRAAQLANAHEFISKLPKGYDTEVGERGNRLSGGERQRISIARAFLKDAPIVILDEPTSSVDVTTEENILSAIDDLLQGRTSFIVSHRLSAIKNCDTYLNIDNGQVLIN